MTRSDSFLAKCPKVRFFKGGLVRFQGIRSKEKTEQLVKKVLRIKCGFRGYHERSKDH